MGPRVAANDANGTISRNLLGFPCERKYISVAKEEKRILHRCGEASNDEYQREQDAAPCCMKSCKCDRLAALSRVMHVLECVIAFMAL